MKENAKQPAAAGNKLGDNVVNSKKKQNAVIIKDTTPKPSELANDDDTVCPDNCSGHGLCHIGYCYCEPGYTDEKCEVHIESDLGAGIKLQYAFYWFGTSMIVGFVVGLFWIHK